MRVVYATQIATWIACAACRAPVTAASPAAPTSPAAPSSPAAPLAGRLAFPMMCPDQHSIEDHPSGCVPPDIGPAPLLRLEDYLRSPTACEQGRVNVCTVLLVGPAGSHALVCRDTRGTITGPVRLVAPDGSVVAEGSCVADIPVGAWLTWSGEQLVSASSYVEPGVQRGLQLRRLDHGYQDGFFPPPPNRGAP